MDVQKKEIIKKMFKNIYGVGYIIPFLAGLAFILSATINIYLDKKQSIEYKKVVATYHSYNKLESYNPIEEKHKTEYEGIYKFEANGQTYYVTPTNTKGSAPVTLFIVV